MKPRLLDLCCGAGGAARGYVEAGFHVTGVDHADQPRYAGHEFVRAHVFDFLRGDLHGYDCIHASPPCQQFSVMTRRHGGEHRHPDLIRPLRRLLVEGGRPFVIENVVGSPLQLPVLLCGSMFDLPLRRHRLFETSFDVPALPCRHGGKVVHVYGHTGGSSVRGGVRFGTLKDWQGAMGIDWMLAREMAQAIPPAYTRYIGRFLREAL